MNHERHFLLAATPLLFLALGLDPSLATAAESVSNLTGSWQLFVDDYLIAEKTNVVRTYHPFEKYPQNPVILPDKPWMDHGVKSGTVLHKEDRTVYRMWHS